MLFFAAAILYSSVHLTGVAGTIAAPVHEITPTTTTSEVTLSAPVQGVPVDSSDLDSCGAATGVVSRATRAGAFSPADCLAQLGGVPDDQLARFGRSFESRRGDDVAFATDLAERGSAAADAAWWESLPASRQIALIQTMPGVVGNLEGVPYTTRDTANRITLERTISALRRSGETAVGFFGGGEQAKRLTMLEQVEIALDRGREQDDSPRQLLSLDTVFPGRAAVSVGNVDTADNVTLMVPGMLYTVSNQITWWTDRAADLHSEQNFWSNTLATTTSAPESSATVAWMGYRTPDLTNVLGLSLAEAGAVHLEDTVKGIDAARESHRPRVNIIAHSYGSTAATIALSSHTIHVDSFTVLGSPGSVAPKARDLAVAAGSVYAAAAAFDPVAGSGVFGADPGAPSFGATLLNVAGGTDPFTEQHLTATLTHNTYFTPGSESVRNLALIGIGRGELTGGRVPDPDLPPVVAGPSLGLVRPQDVYLESIAA